MTALLLLSNCASAGEQSVEVKATAYCPCSKCCGKWAKYGKTKTGTDARTPGIAVDPKVIKLGSKVSIPGIGIRNADDVGGAIKGNRIDVRFATHAEAKRFGRQTIRVKVIE